MNLLTELTANAYQIDRRASGKRVTFAVDGEEAGPERSAMAMLNSRFHYARTVHQTPFDLFWHPATGVFHLRVTVGRRILPVPEGAQRIGRYDRASRWEDVKADFLAVMGANG